LEKLNTVTHYIDSLTDWKSEVVLLRELCIEAGFTETLKWSIPTYTINNKNVVGIAAFKTYVGLCFFNGIILKDPYQKLINAHEGKTKRQLQWRFEKMEKINPHQVLEYLKEAIQNEKSERKLKINRNKTIILPTILENALSKDAKLLSAFENFRPFKKREFVAYISAEKQEETQFIRLEKCIPLILEGIGINDKYRRTTMQ
jgi:uncharacterized protein YdeI (YjbR/CyaY-like superfamily)